MERKRIAQSASSRKHGRTGTESIMIGLSMFLNVVKMISEKCKCGDKKKKPPKPKK